MKVGRPLKRKTSGPGGRDPERGESEIGGVGGSEEKGEESEDDENR